MLRFSQNFFFVFYFFFKNFCQICFLFKFWKTFFFTSFWRGECLKLTKTKKNGEQIYLKGWTKVDHLIYHRSQIVANMPNKWDAKIHLKIKKEILWHDFKCTLPPWNSLYFFYKTFCFSVLKITKKKFISPDLFYILFEICL